MEELAKTYTPSPDEVLYNEAKLALGRGEVDAALALFQQVKKGYQNTSAYVAQCHTYRRLCDAGVVQRSRDSMRATLQALLPHACGMVLCKYSEVLRRHGYDSHMMEGLTLMQVDAVAEATEMKAGHRVVLEMVAAKNSQWYEVIAYHVSRAVQKCGGIERVVQKLTPVPSTKVSLSEEEEEEEEEEEDTSPTGDEDPTAGDES